MKLGFINSPGCKPTLLTEIKKEPEMLEEIIGKVKELILDSTDETVTENLITATDDQLIEKVNALGLGVKPGIDMSDALIVEKAKELVVDITEEIVTEAAVVAPEDKIVEKMKEVVNSLAVIPTEDTANISIDDDTIIQKAKDLVVEVTADDVTIDSVSVPDEVILEKVTDIINEIIVSDEVLMEKVKEAADSPNIIVNEEVVIEKAKELILETTDETVTSESVSATDEDILEKINEVIEEVIINDAILMDKAIEIVEKTVVPGIVPGANPETVEEAFIQVDDAKAALEKAEKVAEKLAPEVIDEKVPATILPEGQIAIKEGETEDALPSSVGVVGVDVAITSIPTVDIGGSVVQVKPLHQHEAVCHDIYDGDTCYIDLKFLTGVSQDNLPVILRRINAPELKGENKEKGKASRDWLKSKIDGKKVVVILYVNSTNRSNQWAVEIFLDDVNINDLSVAEGHAVYK